MLDMSLEKELEVVRRFTDSEIEATYKSLPELLVYYKSEIIKALETEKLKIIVTKRYLSGKEVPSSNRVGFKAPEVKPLTKNQLELDNYLSKFDGEILIDTIYSEYFKYMDKYASFIDKHNKLKEELKSAKETDPNAYDSNGIIYTTRKSPKEIAKLEAKIEEIGEKISKIEMPKIIVDLFNAYSVYMLTCKYKEIVKERKRRGLSKTNNRKK